MAYNLSEAFKAAKKDRQVLSKLIIWESGVSKTQFYRIINGDEAASPETRDKISKSLGITPDQFDLLHKNSKKTELKSRRELTSNDKWFFPFVALLVLSIGFSVFTLANFSQRDSQPRANAIANQDDSTLFIKDVTIPDGTPIPINTEFEKIWRVKNTGRLVWKDRYLKRMTPASSLICSSPSMVPIPETKPGETVDIAVTFKTPYLPGSCRTDWKAADKDGNLYFPDMHGLYKVVIVTAE